MQNVYTFESHKKKTTMTFKQQRALVWLLMITISISIWLLILSIIFA